MSHYSRAYFPVAAACLMLAAAVTAHAADDAEARIEKLNGLIAEQWEHSLRETPEFATIVGDTRYNDRWSDLSLAHVAETKRDTEDYVRRFEAIDVSGLPEQDRINQQLMLRNLRENLRSIELKTYEMPIDQMDGVHLMLPQFVSAIPFETVQHYEDYAVRLRQVPRLFDQTIEVLQQGVKDGLMPPRFLLEKVAVQTRAIGAPAAADSVFAEPLQRFPDSVPAADRERLSKLILAAIEQQVRPAYAKFAAHIARNYAPKGRSQPGLWSLPDGDARYREAAALATTTQMSPEAIHQLGLAEVARIEGEMTAIAHRLGHADLKAFRAALKTDPKVHAQSREQILDLYRKYIAQMEPQLPKLFGLLPKAKMEVLAVQEYREKEAAGAEYQQGTPDGSRPGKVYVNTGDYENRTLLSIESTAYHEGVPGHHMQISIAQELPSLPPFRQQAGYTAYVEGWALYSERLGKDIGFYQDPYSDYGRLSDELLRACRLVLDTGVHYKHWTRAQMIDYFRAHSSEDEPGIQAETDRYIAWPGQALGYKIGQLKILELRERAKQQLGVAFDIRGFHDLVLSGGALPLDMLEARVDGWIAANRSPAVR